MEERGKLKYLNSLEVEQTATVDVSSKKKYFVTFPYPYMNGKLHLGHGFSISKADFLSHYKELEGYNVLFPFSFHCTGMPISASAKKLQEELDGKEVDVSVKSILESFGFEDVQPFVDSNHWIRVFPALCMDSLKRFHCNVDWRRSFITTDINKYYDSFVKWQFKKLKEKGYISFGKRYSIFCPVDKQMCLDHDRRKGENVKPVPAILVKLQCDDGTLLTRMKQEHVPCGVTFGNSFEFIEFKYNGKTYFAEESIFNNISAQVNGVERGGKRRGNYFCVKQFKFFGREISCNMTEREGVSCTTKDTEGGKRRDIMKSVEAEIKSIRMIKHVEYTLTETENFIEIYEPEEEVISRSGGKCIVALTDQWYIDYCNVEWKEKVKSCVRKLLCNDNMKEALVKAVDWVDKWGFSRTFGLGTRIPWDPVNLIDSLSDSTIYMVLYTFKHFMYSDLEGEDEIFPRNELNDNVWDYILLGKEFPRELLKFEDILKSCRESFEYFYPVDIRVSGKDLVKNHLVFFLFAHVAMFDEKYWPQRIFTNGHLMLNSSKMSKSSGNFLTIDDAVRNFGVSSSRMCLAVCGDTNDDANFVEATANAFILKLYSYVKSIKDVCGEGQPNALALVLPGEYENMNFLDKFLVQTISFNISLAIESHENMVYRDVVKYAFYEMMHAKETYCALGGSSGHVVFLLYKEMTRLLYPIIPSLARHLIETHFQSEFSLPVPLTHETSEMEAISYLKSIQRKILVQNKKKKYTDVDVFVGVERAEWKVKCMDVVDNMRCELSVGSMDISDDRKKESTLQKKVVDAVREILKTHGVSERNGIPFSMSYLHHPENHRINFDEYKVLNDFKQHIAESTCLNVSVYVDTRADPGVPILEFK